MRPLVAAAFLFVLAEPCAGQTVVRAGVGQVPEVRLNVGPVGSAPNLAPGQGGVGLQGPAMTFSGSVLSFTGAKIQDGTPDLPFSIVPSVGIEQVPGLQGLPAAPGASVAVPEGRVAPAAPSAGALTGVPVGETANLPSIPENPVIGVGSMGKLADEPSRGGGGAGFSVRAAAIARHLMESGKVAERDSEFAEVFGRRLADLMLGTEDARSGGVEGGPTPVAAGRSESGAGLRLGPAVPGDSPAGVGPAGGGVDGLVAAAGLGLSAGSQAGSLAVGRIVMETSALTLRFSHVFPMALSRFAADAAARSSAALLDDIVVPAPLQASPDAGRTPTLQAATVSGLEEDLAYPGGFGSFMASVGSSMVPQAAIPSPSRPALTEPGYPRSGSAREWSEPGRAETAPVRRARARGGFGGLRFPAAPISLLSFALLPLALAALEIRSRA